MTIPEEIRKGLNHNMAQLQDIDFPVSDEASSRQYEDYTELKTKYFRSKWDFFIDQKLSQL